MINYSIPKPHPLVGHFILINSQEEYDRMRVLVEGCGFGCVEDYKQSRYYSFNTNFNVRYYHIDAMSGQQITLEELEKLVELSKIKLPQEMVVCDTMSDWSTIEVIDFYKGQAVTKAPAGWYITYRNFRLIHLHQSEIEQLEAEIKAAQAKIETLKNASK